MSIFLSIEDFANKVGSMITDGIALINDALENSIGTTLVEMLIQLCATLVIFLIVRFMIWNKITSIIEERRKVVRDALNERDEALKEAKKIREEAALIKEESLREKDRIIASARRKADSEATDIIGKAKEEAKLKIDNANEEIDKMKNEANKDIQNEIIDLAYLMASKIVNDEIEKDK